MFDWVTGSTPASLRAAVPRCALCLHLSSRGLPVVWVSLLVGGELLAYEVEGSVGVDVDERGARERFAQRY